MSSLFQRILNFGVTEDIPFRLQNKLRIFNVAGAIIVAINIFYTVLGLLLKWYLAVIFSLASIGFIVLAWFLVSRKVYTPTFHIIMAYAFAFLVAFSWLFGEDTRSFLFFLFIPVAVSIMFDNKVTQYFYLGLTIACVIGMFFVFRHVTPYYYAEKQMLYIFGYANSAFAIVLIFSGVRQFKRENQTYSEEIEVAKESIEEKNKEITDSINYASRIQKAIIPQPEEFTQYFKDAFVLLKPRDIVSGDFYWIAQSNNSLFFAIADCTGHGVPGGFMTMLGVSFLDEIVKEKNEHDPGKILDLLREKIISSLRQTGAAGENKDGMDIVLCRKDNSSSKIYFSGANNSIYFFNGKELKEFKGNKQPCGFYHAPFPFTTNELDLEEGGCLYLFTDGFPDQFGGAKGKKFKYKQLEEKIAAVSASSMADQKEQLNQSFENWKGTFEQVDDVLLAGIRF